MQNYDCTETGAFNCTIYTSFNGDPSAVDLAAYTCGFGSDTVDAQKCGAFDSDGNVLSTYEQGVASYPADPVEVTNLSGQW